MVWIDRGIFSSEPQYLPIMGEFSEFPSLNSMLSDPEQLIPMLLVIRVINVPFGRDMLYTQSWPCG